MQQVPFDTPGVAAKINELYALSDSQLAQQALQIRNNFDQWVMANFILTNDQSNYLAGMSATAKKRVAYFTAVGIELRLPFNYSKEDSGPITSKRFGLLCDVEFQSQPGHPDTSSGGIKLVSDYSGTP